jgi:flagellar basal body rod protein FlgF
LWIEGNHPDGLRARITRTLDSTGDQQGMTTVATPEGGLRCRADMGGSDVDPIVAATIASPPTIAGNARVTLPGDAGCRVQLEGRAGRHPYGWEEPMLAAVGGIGIVGLIVAVLVVMAIVYFVRRA